MFVKKMKLAECGTGALSELDVARLSLGAERNQQLLTTEEWCRRHKKNHQHG